MDEMDQFLQRQILTWLNRKIDNLPSPASIKEIEEVVENLPTNAVFYKGPNPIHEGLWCDNLPRAPLSSTITMGIRFHLVCSRGLQKSTAGILSLGISDIVDLIIPLKLNIVKMSVLSTLTIDPVSSQNVSRLFL